MGRRFLSFGWVVPVCILVLSACSPASTPSSQTVSSPTTQAQQSPTQAKPNVAATAVPAKPVAIPTVPPDLAKTFKYPCKIGDTSTVMNCDSTVKDALCKYVESSSTRVEQLSCFETRICNTGSTTFRVAATVRSPVELTPFDTRYQWGSSGWYGVVPNGCTYFTGDYHRGSINQQPSRVIMGFLFTDSSGVTGSGKVNLNAQNAPTLGNCKSFSSCVTSTGTPSICVNPKDVFELTWRDPQTVPCGRGYSFLPSSFDYHPYDSDDYTLYTAANPIYHGATFMIGFGPNDRATPLQ